MTSSFFKKGKISAIDPANAKVKVSIGQTTTTWLPWLNTRAGEDSLWWPLSIGEQVIVLAPEGNLNQGVVLGSIYYKQFPAKESRADVCSIQYSDGTKISYDKSNKKLSIDCQGEIEIKASGKISIKSDVEVSLDAPKIKLGGDRQVARVNDRVQEITKGIYRIVEGSDSVNIG